jgi:hypothetical protein
MSSWSFRSVHCSRTGSGHMGATPQPKRTVASDDNQHRKCRKSGTSNVTEGNQRSGESIDTVGVTGSIPVSPTNGGPVFRGLPSFPDLSRAALGPHERWLRWIETGRSWPGCGPRSRPASADRGFRHALPRWAAAFRPFGTAISGSSGRREDRPARVSTASNVSCSQATCGTSALARRAEMSAITGIRHRPTVDGDRQ